MSQFSQKYYKHYKVNNNEVKKPYTQEVQTKRKFGFFEILVIILLLIILFCLCTSRGGMGMMLGGSMLGGNMLGGGMLGGTNIAQNSITKPTTQPQNDTVQSNSDQSYTLQEKIPKLVLPDPEKIIPVGEVSIEDYMYFVYDTHRNYPAFLDQDTNRIIKEKRPSCVELECPITQISQEDKESYKKWLEKISSKELQIQKDNNIFTIIEK